MTINKQLRLKWIIPATVLAVAFLLPTVIPSSSASAATADPSKCIPASKCPKQPVGTCFGHVETGDPSTTYQIHPCTKFGVKNGDKETDGKYKGKPVDLSKYCYEYSASQSSNSLVRVGCDDSSLSPPPTAMCTDNKTGKTVKCVTCPDGSTSAPGDCSNALTGGNCSSINHCDLMSKYINPLIKFLAALVGVGTVISIIIGGIQYSSSAGDPAKIGAAKNRIRNSIIALVTFMFLYALLNFLIPGGL